MSTLRVENQRYRNEMVKAKRDADDLQLSFSRKYRGSMSRLDAHLDDQSKDFGEKMHNMNEKHKSKLEELKTSMAKKQEEWFELVAVKNTDISRLKGRLEEARNARESTLEAMRGLKKNHNKAIQQLEESLEVLMNRYQMLQTEKGNILVTHDKVEETLRESLSEKDHLNNRLEVASNDSTVKQKKIDELDAIVTRLEGSLNCLEQQKDELYDKTKEYMEKGHMLDIEAGITRTLKEQLEKCETSLEIIKGALLIQTQKSKVLEKANSIQDQELVSLRVELRIMTRKRKELENTLTNKTDDCLALSAEIAENELQRIQAEEKATRLQKTVANLETKVSENADLILNTKKIIFEREQELRDVEEKVLKLQMDQVKTLSQIDEFEQIKDKVSEQDEQIQEKERIILSQDQKISQLRTSIRVLKDTCLILEEQLKEFEVAISEKGSQLDEFIRTSTSNESLQRELENTQKELHGVREKFKEAKSACNVAETNLMNLEADSKIGECDKSNKIKNLTEKIAVMQKANVDLSDQLDYITNRLNESDATRLCLTKVLENQRSENILIKKEASKKISELVGLKERVPQLEQYIETATRQTNFQLVEFQAAQRRLATVEREKQENEGKLQATIDQQAKLVSYLQAQIEFLGRRKKTITEKIFGRDKENHPVPVPISAPYSHLQGEVDHHITAQQFRLENILTEAVDRTPIVRKEECILLKQNGLLIETLSTPKCITKTHIFSEDGGDRLYVNCVKQVFEDLYLFGCESGLYSTKISDKDPSNRTKIEGVDAIHQIEFISKINYALMTEGKDRRLGLVALGLLRTCAEATPTAKPKLKLNALPDVENCHLFSVGRTSSGSIVLVTTTLKTLNIFFWEKDTFVQKLNLRTPKTVTCIVATPSSVIYGSDKIFELDLKNLTVEEFLDESDESLFYVKTTCRDSANYPVAILDVGSQSTESEYLLCFSDVGIFTDSFGRRSREMDVVWSKLPLTVAYRSPNLYVLHFGSLEIIRLTEESYRKEQRTAERSKSNIPESRHLLLSCPRLLGLGKRTPSAYVGSFPKAHTQIYEVCMEDDINSNK